jgi:hypothetical protein
VGIARAPDGEMSVKVGRPIVVGDVIFRSARILIDRPFLMIPQVIVLIPALVVDLLTSSSPFNPLGLIIGILSGVLSVIVTGAYPPLVKAALEGGQHSVTEALGKAYHRFWTLLVAGILVVLIVALGFIALIVPGIILLTWYAYTVPAIMLEGKGATEGMAASKAFGRDKKGSTFLIFLTVFLVGLLLFVVESILSLGSRLLGQLVFSILDVPLGAWVAVMVTYTYITYGMSSATATMESGGVGVAPLASPQATAQPSASVGTPGGFCQFCGSPVTMASKYCRKCGNPL